MLAQISVMFVDVRGFTALSEKFEPATMVAKLNRFYRLAAHAVFNLDGTLDKMVGDQVMAFFGAPFRPEDHADRAVQAALEIVSGSQNPGDGFDGLPVGGGVATGEVFMGNVGEGEVRDFTVIGDTVNTAARLQALAGPGEVLVTDETYRDPSANFSSSEERTLELKGKEAPILAHLLRNEGQPDPSHSSGNTSSHT
ncbi:MAG: adenylate/guanylate cyclase domain-containing protein [Chloroflexi bacterium]|nr:adenylate/guanylate cyclase domain-containing protein [Chloroflexota bacterium]